MARSQRRTALFYDAPLSSREDIALLKAMLLFFDDIAVFSTPAHHSRPPAVDPYLIAPLADRGPLQFLNPRAVMTSQTEVIICSTLHRAAIEKADHWLGAAAAGHWDLEVPRLQGRVSSDVSPPGDTGSLELYKFLAQDGWLFPEESADDEWVIAPGIASDLSAVTLDLSGVGLDDILDFRNRHRIELRAYVRSLHGLLASQGFADRKAALVDQAARLRELQSRRWPNIASTVSLGIIGASWTLGAGDLLGALIGGTAAGSPLSPDRPTPASAYAYLLRPDGPEG